MLKLAIVEKIRILTLITKHFNEPTIIEIITQYSHRQTQMMILIMNDCTKLQVMM